MVYMSQPCVEDVFFGTPIRKHNVSWSLGLRLCLSWSVDGVSEWFELTSCLIFTFCFILNGAHTYGFRTALRYPRATQNHQTEQDAKLPHFMIKHHQLILERFHIFTTPRPTSACRHPTSTLSEIIFKSSQPWSPGNFPSEAPRSHTLGLATCVQLDCVIIMTYAFRIRRPLLARGTRLQKVL